MTIGLSQASQHAGDVEELDVVKGPVMPSPQELNDFVAIVRMLHSAPSNRAWTAFFLAPVLTRMTAGPEQARLMPSDVRGHPRQEVACGESRYTVSACFGLTSRAERARKVSKARVTSRFGGSR